VTQKTDDAFDLDDAATEYERPRRRGPSDRKEQAGGPRMVRALDVKEEKVEWLWGRRIPKRSITFFSGDPGIGKSHIAMDLAARMSAGGQWPDSGAAELGATLFLSSEDGYSDVLRPRLRVAGADLARIGFLTGKEKADQPGVEFLLTLKEDLAALEAALPKWTEQLGLPIRMLVVDPFLNHLGDIDPNREGQLRPLLADVAAFTRRTALALIGIRHLNKAQEKSLLYRPGGNIAFTGAARAEYLVGTDPKDPARRVVARIKGNLSLEPVALAFSIVAGQDDPDISRIEWHGPTNTRPEDMVGPPPERKPALGSQGARAEEMLLELLGEGQAVPAEKIFERAAEEEIGEKSVRAAARRLGVRKKPSGFGAGWIWCLTEDA